MWLSIKISDDFNNYISNASKLVTHFFDKPKYIEYYNLISQNGWNLQLTLIHKKEKKQKKLVTKMEKHSTH